WIMADAARLGGRGIHRDDPLPERAQPDVSGADLDDRGDSFVLERRVCCITLPDGSRATGKRVNHVRAPTDGPHPDAARGILQKAPRRRYLPLLCGQMNPLKAAGTLIEPDESGCRSYPQGPMTVPQQSSHAVVGKTRWIAVGVAQVVD